MNQFQEIYLSILETEDMTKLLNGDASSGDESGKPIVVNGDSSPERTKVKSTLLHNGYVTNSDDAEKEIVPFTEDGHGVDLLQTNKLEQLKGPDQLLPSQSLWTPLSDGAVILRVGEDFPSKLPPISVPSFVENAVVQNPYQVALAVKRDGNWIKWTYKQYLDEIRMAAKALIRLGLERFHSVCIIGFNSPEWFIANFATIFAGGLTAGIYTTNSAEVCVHCAQNSKANIVIVEDEKQLQKFLPNRDKMPDLKAIIQYSGTTHDEGVLSWGQFMFLGAQEPDTLLDQRLKQIAINQCCSIIYTSGTTGPPKGAMLSHDNVLFEIRVMNQYLQAEPGKEEIISFLPLSHVAAQLSEIYFPISCNATVYFADKDALKGSLGTTMKEVRPTIFLGVPRVWEKIFEKMQAVAHRTKGVKKFIGAYAKRIGWKYTVRRMNRNQSKPYLYNVANALVFKKVKEALGLDRCTRFLSGAAPMSMEVLKHFASLDIIVCELYGMTESSGANFITTEAAFHLGSAGRTFSNCLSKLQDIDEEGNGEVCMWGRNVFMGYLGMPEETEKVIDADGWLHSGDIGKMDDGYIFITGRIKELIITAGGENIPPVLIEDTIKAELPCVSNVMLIGDKRKFLSCIITLKTEIDKVTEQPIDTLAPPAETWCKQLGCNVTTVSEILQTKDQRIYNAIQDGINRANKKAISNAQKVQKFIILPQDFSIAGGELGPTMKLKRHITEKKFTEEIEVMYSGGS